ncbi:MAG: hypothetical protein IJK19_04640 [Bacteroidales bacterium]|nr:hypothetical protein [Bacteroidales bacterium]
MEKTYDVGAAKYAAKKLLQSCKRGNINDPRLTNYLSTILIFAEDRCLPTLKVRMQRVINCTGTKVKNYSDIFEDIQKIEAQISKASEKKRVMERRYNSACLHYKQELNKSDHSKYQTKLNVYDVIKVPTQGGMHYSIISEVNDDYVTCFPMTTASKNNLDLIGTKSVSLSGCGDSSYKGIRLTASATRVPHDRAIKTYMGSVANNSQICKQLAKVVSFA